MIRFTALLVAACISSLAVAHHSLAPFFDRTSSAELEGVVDAVHWRNPHLRITLSVVNESGEAESWQLEGGSVNELQRRGYSADTFPVGQTVRVAGMNSLSGANLLAVTNVLLPDGREVVVGNAPNTPLKWTEEGSSSRGRIIDEALAERARREAQGIFRVWNRARPLMKTLPYTAAAIAGREAWAPSTDTASRCIPQGLPPVMDNPYPIEFVADGDDIVLRVEEWDTVRTIHMGPDAEQGRRPGHLGYAIGRWEESTLVVETTDVAWPYFDEVGTPQTGKLEMLERFTLSEDENRLDYELTVTDPWTFTAPAVLTGYYLWAPGLRVEPFQCALIFTD